MSAARIISSLVPREMDLVASLAPFFSCLNSNDEKSALLLRSEVNWIIYAPVVAGLLHAIEELLDQASVLSLGPSGRFVLCVGHVDGRVSWGCRR